MSTFNDTLKNSGLLKLLALTAVDVLAGYITEPFQQAKHLYYHLRGIPHLYTEEDFGLGYEFQRLDRPHTLNPKEDELFDIKIG